MSDRKKITAATAVLSSATLISRFGGLARDIVIASLFGAGFGSDAFFMAFTIPNLLRRFFAEGSLTAAFVPTFTQVRQQHGEIEARRVVNICWSLLLVVMIGVTLCGMLASPWLVKMIGGGFAQIPGKMELTIHLTRLMFPYIFFVSLLALLTGVLNVYGHYFIPAISPLVLNVAMIVSAIVFHQQLSVPVEALAWGVLAGGLLQLAMTLPVMRRYGFNLKLCFKWRDVVVQRIGRLMIPGVVGVAIYQINVVVTRLLSSFLEQGSVSYLYYGQRLFEFPQGIFVVSLAQAVLPTMSRQAAAGKVDEVKESLRYALTLIVLITVPAAAGLLVCATPIYSQLFMSGAFSYTDVQQTALALAAYAPGLLFVGISRVIVPTFYAMKDTRTPVVVSFWTLLVNVAFGLALMGGFHHVGLALALTLSSIFNAMVLLVLLQRRLGSLALGGVVQSALRVIVATAVMAVIVQRLLLFGDWAAGLTLENFAILIGAISGGLVVYALSCYLLNIKEMHDVVAIAKRRLKIP
ncbi:MAG: murein biosynthesis integral membrane protein MurJ [Thermodesulfobacteriota bacterium]|nr:murein biosynthesis integral membrane protein MurJ [Thermodesulfobacteriota bacterium]